MGAEESGHRASLIATYRERFGEHIPLIAAGCEGLYASQAVLADASFENFGVRKQAEIMELETRQFYRKAMGQVTMPASGSCWAIWKEVERKHQITAEAWKKRSRPMSRSKRTKRSAACLVLQIVQPGLAGLMDGSVSTLAPVFAAALPRGAANDAFLVGLAASIGAGISMAFAEALSDDGSLTGRGRPVLRGAVTGLMTAAGGIGHTLPS